MPRRGLLGNPFNESGQALRGYFYTSIHHPLGDVFSNDLPTLALGSDVVVVLEVVWQLLDLHLREPGFLEHILGLLFAPHRA